MRFILLLLLTFIHTQELEVEGDLKVTGNIDASNKRITNVASPTLTTDAVNAEYLDDVLRDDGLYEYTYYAVLFLDAFKSGDDFYTYYKSLGDVTFSSHWENKVDELAQDGWKINNIIRSNHVHDYDIKAIYEFRRNLED